VTEYRVDLIAVFYDEVFHDSHTVLGCPLIAVLRVQNRDVGAFQTSLEAVASLNLRVMSGLSADLYYITAGKASIIA
jgi:hypothetical protein